ncbi:MAG TPA: protein-L-isoaspartate(D-aspartate) O-methyltransferase [Actinomycetota bacterium]|nr:protein-L-isoaspartate(D-aspartate) O-methyltransferase [Actinomycetota bacterium]
MKWTAADHDDLVRIIEREVDDPRIVDAFRSVRREDFVPEGAEGEAYEDRPVPLPNRQTTSQPSLIARMIDAAAIEPDDRVLEIGTGYGFQTALLASLAREVVSVDRYPELVEAARANLADGGFTNVTVILGDGWDPIPDRGPFDATIVSAAAPEIPDALVDQLVEGGRLVIPLKTGRGELVELFVKTATGMRRERHITPARFVPLVRGVDA